MIPYTHSQVIKQKVIPPVWKYLRFPEICVLFQHNYLLGKKMTRTAKKKKKKLSNKLFNGEALWAGSWTQTRQVEEVRAQTMLEAAYISLLEGWSG